jgi:hypothetical protein
MSTTFTASGHITKGGLVQVGSGGVYMRRCTSSPLIDPFGDVHRMSPVGVCERRWLKAVI